MKRTYYIYTRGESIPVQIESQEGGKFLLRFPDRNSTYELTLVRPGVALISREDGKVQELLFREEASQLHITVAHEEFLLEILDELEKARREKRGGAQGAGILKALMPGRVVAVLVKEGDLVQEGQGVLIVSAMKMENELKAPVTGVVSKVYVAAGNVVEAGALLVEIRPPEKEG